MGSNWKPKYEGDLPFTSDESLTLEFIAKIALDLGFSSASFFISFTATVASWMLMCAGLIVYKRCPFSHCLNGRELLVRVTWVVTPALAFLVKAL